MSVGFSRQPRGNNEDYIQCVLLEGNLLRDNNFPKDTADAALRDCMY